MIEQCKSCKNKEIINGIVGCVYMDADCQNGEKYEAEIITNADRIRAMTDEELEKFIQTIKTRAALCKAVKNNDAFKELCSAEWLQQPAE